MDINDDAPVITRDEIMISAPIQKVWNIQTDVEAWPSWQPEVDGAVADGPLREGSVFRWQTAYRFTQPKYLPKGSQILCTGSFDNSTQNFFSFGDIGSFPPLISAVSEGRRSRQAAGRRTISGVTQR